MTCNELIKDHMAEMAGKSVGNNNYGHSHNMALCQSVTTVPRTYFEKSKMEQAIVMMIRGCANYADAHFSLYEQPLGECAILGDYWLDMMKSIRRMLNGEIGRLYAGAVDTLLCDLAVNVGFTKEQFYG
ncbi:unnamed protein product [Sphagnum jensenii]|uniref:Uncharacterized protein n=1 Tax=Sphagnum jensenii TaxID=128206 RepID=A0ABP0VA26_9BRYO